MPPPAHAPHRATHEGTPARRAVRLDASALAFGAFRVLLRDRTFSRLRRAQRRFFGRPCVRDFPRRRWLAHRRRRRHRRLSFAAGVVARLRSPSRATFPPIPRRDRHRTRHRRRYRTRRRHACAPRRHRAQFAAKLAFALRVSVPQRPHLRPRRRELILALARLRLQPRDARRHRRDDIFAHRPRARRPRGRALWRRRTRPACAATVNSLIQRTNRRAKSTLKTAARSCFGARMR